MKKQKLKSLVSDAKKSARKEIRENLFSELKTIADKLVPPSKKIEKAIKKDSKELAKKISRKLVIDKSKLVSAYNQKNNDTEKSSDVAKSKPAASVKNGTRKPASNGPKKTAVKGEPQS